MAELVVVSFMLFSFMVVEDGPHGSKLHLDGAGGHMGGWIADCWGPGRLA